MPDAMGQTKEELVVDHSPADGHFPGTRRRLVVHVGRPRWGLGLMLSWKDPADAPVQPREVVGNRRPALPGAFGDQADTFKPSN